MKYFRVKVAVMDYQRLIDEINVFKRDRSLKRAYNHEGPDLLEGFEFEGGSDIRSVSGRRATFQQDPRVYRYWDGQVREKDHRIFQMVVWDD
uniref:DUF1330 domain-containing protein n=1 Tax=Caenorhabditis tropicalis TaxID=1561998 RepID=A0A1I7U1J5_9PELO